MRGAMCAMLMLLTFSDSIQVDRSAVPSERLAFVGTVTAVAPDSGWVSGALIVVYRLAKYRVEHVCVGRYDSGEIVVDHIILDGKEFKDIKVGDRVYVDVSKYDSVFRREDAEGIRDSSEEVDVFFVGGAPRLAESCAR